MRVVATPERLHVGPGEPGAFTVEVTNTSSMIDAYHLQVFGLDPKWVAMEPRKISLFPGETDNVAVTLNLPPEHPSTARTLAINVVSEANSEEFTLAEVVVDVSPEPLIELSVDPVMITAGRRATFGLHVTNTGNTEVTAAAGAIDPENTAKFTFVPPLVTMPVGTSQVIHATAEGGRAWFGQPRARTFTFRMFDVSQGGPPSSSVVTPESIATFIQRPRIGRWMMSLIGLLLAALVFAYVLNRTVRDVVEPLDVDDQVLEEALADPDPGAARVPTNPGTIVGTAKSASQGTALAGVVAELFVLDDTTTPIRTATSGDSGDFALTNLSSGSYKLRLSGPGIQTVWFPTGETAPDGAIVEVDLDDQLSDDERVTSVGGVTVAGAPVAVTGTIDAADVVGVTMQLVVRGQIDPELSALVDTITPAGDGSFSFAGVPTPGTYDLLIEKDGASPETRRVDIAPGQPIDGLDIVLKDRNGLITGTVTDPSGNALGGAMVTATTGTTSIETVTLTEDSTTTGAAAGEYTLRSLATPEQYTVTISRPGFTPEIRTISLDDDRPSDVFSTRLLPAQGSIRGTATIGGVAAPGLTVSITGGEVDRTTQVTSQPTAAGSVAGSFGFAELPIPGTYTLTFSGSGTIPQVRVVRLDRTSPVATGVAVSMNLTATSVRGVVFDENNELRSQVTVQLSDGVATRTFLTADSPRGEFEFSDVLPGTYTLTASLKGTVPDVELITIVEGQGPQVERLDLGKAASLGGTVVGTEGIEDFNPARETVNVRLFLPDLFPIGEPEATTTTSATGSFVFEGLDAPTTYLVAVYRAADSGEPISSQIVSTEPSVDRNDLKFSVALR